MFAALVAYKVSQDLQRRADALRHRLNSYARLMHLPMARTAARDATTTRRT
jgi:hypothetical protein